MRRLYFLAPVLVLAVLLLVTLSGREPTVARLVENPTATTAPSEPAQTSTITSTHTATSAATATSVVTEITPQATPTVLSTATPEPVVIECLLPSAPATSPKPDVSVDAVIGEPLTLDGTVLFGIDGAQPLDWARMTPAPDSLVYASANDFMIEPEGTLARMTFSKPGKYRIVVTAGAEEFDLEVVVQPETRPNMQGVFFPDLFNHNGGPEFRLQRDDPSCQETVFDHAFAGAVRAGAELVGFSPAFVMDQVFPLPKFDPNPITDLSLTDEAHYAQVVGAAKDRGLRVMMIDQDGGPSANLDFDDWINRGTLARDPVWIEAWFDELRAWGLPRARWAEAAGVELLIPTWPVEMSMQPGNGYDRLWREYIADIREVYSGEVGVVFGEWPRDLFTFADAVDFVVIFHWGGALPGRFSDPEKPSYEEAVREKAREIDRAEPVVGDIDAKVYYYWGLPAQTDSSVRRT